MPKASEVATELRKLADALDREPEQELIRPDLDFNCKYVGDADKPTFLALARILPRPLAKGVCAYDADGMQLTYTSPALIVTTEIKRSKVCRLIEPERTIPAKYECEPLLSPEEDAALTEA